MYNYDDVNINTPKPVYGPDILKINETDFVTRQLFEKRGARFYDIVLTKNGEKHDIGRFNKEEHQLQISYNIKSNKLMIYYSEYNKEISKMVIIDILGLYDVEDDMFLVLTKEEAALEFDPSINTNCIKQKKETVLRNDINKRKKIR